MREADFLKTHQINADYPAGMHVISIERSAYLWEPDFTEEELIQTED